MFSNQFNLKLLVKILGVLISILLIVFMIDSYLNSLTYKNPVNLKVAYTNYACENGNLFKVVAVDNNELKKYVGQDLSLLFKNKKNRGLCLYLHFRLHKPYKSIICS
jgi:hypothetical protein